MVSRDLPAPSLALRQLDMSLAHSIDALFDRVLDFKSRGARFHAYLVRVNYVFLHFPSSL